MRRIALLCLVGLVSCTTDTKPAPDVAGGAFALKMHPRTESSSSPPAPKVTPEMAAEIKGEARAALDLERTKDGGYRYVDRDAGFEARIASDGEVTFRNLGVGRADGTVKDAKKWGAGLADAAARDGTHDRPDLEDAPPDDASGRAGALMETIPRFNGDNGPLPQLVGVGGSHGPKAGDNSPAQRKFLERTVELRTRLYKEARVQWIERAAKHAGAETVAILKDGGIPATERKQSAFALWDECLEPTDELAREDARAAEAGEIARDKIEAAIGKVAPAGSKLGYTDAELEALNEKRRSKQRFDPYAE